MFLPEAPIWQTVARTATIYLVILVALRLAGKRELGQLTVFDLLVLLLISNSVQNAMVGTDSSVLGGLIAAAVLLLMDRTISAMVMRFPHLRRTIEGSPTLLILHGEVLRDHLRKEGLDEETLQAALREHGMGDSAEVEMAVLEIDGSISVVPAGQQTKRVRRPPKVLRKP
jgi:uncharacterized membrane protein YcaP (DUF421 family)